VDKLLEAAGEVFQEAGRNPGPHDDAIRSTLEAASIDEATGDLVRSGRLTSEVEPPSGFGDLSPFEVLSGGAGAGTGRAAAADHGVTVSPAARRVRERMQERVAKAEEAASAAREQAAQAGRDLEAATREVDRLDREMRTARRRAERAAKTAAAAEARVEEAERALARAQADLETASEPGDRSS
jgi:hypothetical protein